MEGCFAMKKKLTRLNHYKWHCFGGSGGGGGGGCGGSCGGDGNGSSNSSSNSTTVSLSKQC